MGVCMCVCVCTLPTHRRQAHWFIKLHRYRRAREREKEGRRYIITANTPRDIVVAARLSLGYEDKIIKVRRVQASSMFVLVGSRRLYEFLVNTALARRSWWKGSCLLVACWFLKYGATSCENSRARRVRVKGSVYTSRFSTGNSPLLSTAWINPVREKCSAIICRRYREKNTVHATLVILIDSFFFTYLLLTREQFLQNHKYVANFFSGS